MAKGEGGGGRGGGGGSFIKYSKGPRLAKLPYGLGRLVATSQDAAVKMRTLSTAVNVEFSFKARQSVSA